MNRVFADTHYWLALFSEKDSYHKTAKSLAIMLKNVEVVTSDMVLTEVLNGFSNKGQHIREKATGFVNELLHSRECIVVEQSRHYFTEALSVYSRYKDKEWGLTDCASFVIIKQEKISAILTNDHHFQQMGFKILLP